MRLRQVGLIVEFDTEQEFRRAKHGLHGELDTGFPGIVSFFAFLGELDEPIHFVFLGGPAVGVGGEST